MTDIIETQGAALAVFQPLLRRLVAADMEIPGDFRHVFKVLRAVDPDMAVIKRHRFDRVVAFAGEGIGRRADGRRFHQVQAA